MMLCMITQESKHSDFGGEEEEGQLTYQAGVLLTALQEEQLTCTNLYVASDNAVQRALPLVRVSPNATTVTEYAAQEGGGDNCIALASYPLLVSSEVSEVSEGPGEENAPCGEFMQDMCASRVQELDMSAHGVPVPAGDKNERRKGHKCESPMLQRGFPVGGPIYPDPSSSSSSAPSSKQSGDVKEGKAAPKVLIMKRSF